MKNQAFALTMGVVLVSVLAGVMLITAQQKTPRTSNKSSQIVAGDYRLSGPFTHKNLSIFLVHGKNTFTGKSFITLQEALVQKKVVVYETQSVNELAIENVSNDDVYVQAGDIVKGGQQGSNDWH